MSASDDLLAMAMKDKYVYSMTGLIVGLVFVALGSILFLCGIVGNSSWTTKLVGLESSISDAAPGSLLFVAGLIVVFATRYKVVIKRSLPSGESEEIRFSIK